MSIYAISDLHLAISIDKPMDIFGLRWTDYMEKLKYNWNEIVTEEDIVVIPGDISWATYLEQAESDFKFIDELPGKKIISKGNHDYWWTTASKLNKFLALHKFSTIEFMHNNSFSIGDIVIAGTRGWKCPGDDEFSLDDKKICLREVQRLDLSLKSAISNGKHGEIIVAMHYPPFNAKKEESEFIDVMRNYGVKTCIYGHLHGEGHKNAKQGLYEGIEFKFVAADYLNFKPIRLA
jgi:uncharacterized protein